MDAQGSVLLFRPPPAPRESLPAPGLLVQRWPLFERLSLTPGGGVMLVCGPPGSGKTVLVRSWLEVEGLTHRVAWVSIDRGERDGQRFWLSVIDALAGPAITGDVVGRVSPAPDLRDEVAIERLLADLESLDEPVVLVIDDLHELESADALTSLELFLARLPAQVRVVLVTRADPGLRLHRLRLAGVLTELRAHALRFSLHETRELLEEAGIALPAASVALLHERTEGWAAGLRLAAISLAEHPDPERFVTEFSGSERTVAGYLLAEVLERRPPEVRDLLLRTSLLERVSGPLADLMTGGSGSERLLQELEDASAFVTALDVGRSWFRYHHLFADLLRLELRRLHPTSIRPLHRAAGPMAGAARGRDTGDPPRTGGRGLAACRRRALEQLPGARPRRPDGDTARIPGRLPTGCARGVPGARRGVRQEPASRRPARRERDLPRGRRATGGGRSRRAPAALGAAAGGGAARARPPAR
jgi:LuxR family maltose regulon positive regulatory protein